MPLSAGSIIAMDRAYNDYKLYAQWTENGIYFVTRLKNNADYMLLEVRDVPQNRNIFADELIMFDGYYSKKNYPYLV